MRAFYALWKKELAGFFLSPVDYTVWIFFLVVMGLGFWFMTTLLAENPTGVGVLSEFFGTFLWLPMLVVPPLLTMRLLAEERRTGTIEMLLTTPITDTAVVLAKYAATLTFFVVMVLPTLTYPLVLARWAPDSLQMDTGALAAGYMGVVLVGALYLAIGILCSAMAGSQITAAVMAFTLLTVLFFAGFAGDMSASPQVRHVGDYISSFKHLRDLTRGAVDTRAIVFHVTGAALALFAAIRVTEARRWRP